MTIRITRKSNGDLVAKSFFSRGTSSLDGGANLLEGRHIRRIDNAKTIVVQKLRERNIPDFEWRIDAHPCWIG